MSAFLDSNVVLYALGDDEHKRTVGRGLLAAQPTISTQVVNECSHVLRRKQQFASAHVARLLEEIVRMATVVDVGMVQIRQAWEIASRYQYGHYDSLIIATALSAGCSILYTEDLQHEQSIYGQMTLLDPFREKRALRTSLGIER